MSPARPPPGFGTSIAAQLREVLALDAAARTAQLDRIARTDPARAARLRRLVALDASEQPLLDASLDALAAAVLPAEAQRGERIGSWRLVRCIGSGGMGSVWLAERHRGDFTQQAALKRIHADLGSPDIEARFRQERAVLARLRHPHIAPLVDGGVDARGQPWLAMQWVDGVPLREWLQGAPRLRTRLELFCKLCRAVAHAHARLVVHRDLKPGNILVQENAEPCLLDFGIAKLLDDHGGELTQAAQRFLTPAYAAPEQLRGEPASTATDVYGLGALLFELLTGQRRSRGQADAHATTRPSEAVRREASTGAIAAARLRGDLDAITLRACASEPERRYPTAAALGDDVQRFLDGHAVLARPDSAAYRLRRWLRRNRIAGAAITLALAALLGGTAISLWQADRAGRARAVAEAEATRARAALAGIEDLFAVADPRNNAGAPISARELLDQGSARLATRFAARPEFTAALAGTLGRLYERLGALDVAETHLHAALAATSAAPGQVAERVTALRDLAALRSDRGDMKEGLAWIEEALRLEAALAPADAMRRHDLRTVQANLLRRTGARERARPLHVALLAEAEALYGPEALEVATAATNLAYLDLAQDQHAAGIALLRRALAIHAARLGPEHLDTARARSVLAEWLEGADDPGESEALQRQALATFRAVLPPDHLETASALNSLGLILSHQGRYEEADRELQEAVTLAAAPGSGSQAVLGSALNNLALNDYNRGHLGDAADNFRRAHAVMLALHGEEHPETLRAEMALGAAELGRGDFARAETTLLHSRAARARLHGTHDPVYVNTLNLLASLYLQTARPAAALAPLEEARAIEAAGVDRWDLPALTRTFHSHALLALGRTEEARAAAEDALALFTARHGDDNVIIARAEVALAEVALTQGRAAAALALAGRALARRQAVLEADDTQLLEAAALVQAARCLATPGAGAMQARDAAAAALAARQPWHPRLAAWRALPCSGGD